MSQDWHRRMPELSPEPDGYFSMRFYRADARDFFNATSGHPLITKERVRCLEENPGRHAAMLPDGKPMMDETLRLAQTWDPAFFSAGSGDWPSDPYEQLLFLGRRWEPDFLLLRQDAHGIPRLRGACVCFPSSWSLHEKMGCSLAEIHAPVPGLNSVLGTRIDRFMQGIRPGTAWMRINWGMSRSNLWNQHPELNLPRLERATPPERIWFRVEHQALVRLPNTQGILFGIRIAMHPLTDVKRRPSLAGTLRAQLRSMPEPLAIYKNLDQARETILDYLEETP